MVERGGEFLRILAAADVLLVNQGTVITLDAAGRVSIQANATVEVTAASLNVHAPTAIFDGMVNCTTLIASVGVVSPSYTPGAGNVW